MSLVHHGELLVALEAGASLVNIVLAAAAFTVASWKHSALAVQKEVTETYRQCAEAEHMKVLDLECRVRRLDARTRHLEFERERFVKKQAATRAEIEQFEQIVRLMIAARTTIRPDTRASIERLLAGINRAREDSAAELFAWEQTRSVLQAAGASAV